MKILVVSDTHGSESNLEEVLEKEKPLDWLIHLGDLEGAEEYIEIIAECPVTFIRGNCDFLSSLPDEDVIKLEDVRIFLTHGHYYYVSRGEMNLLEEGRDRNAQIVLYGHTHIPSITEYKGITVMNPGSLTFPRQQGRRPSYIVMDIEHDMVDAEIMYL